MLLRKLVCFICCKSTGKSERREDFSPVPAARFARYSSRQGAENAKCAKGKIRVLSESIA
jgi:hypothetical protein